MVKEFKQFEISKNELIVRNMSPPEDMVTRDMSIRTSMWGMVSCKALNFDKTGLGTECAFNIDSEEDIEKIVTGLNFGNANESIIKGLNREFRKLQ